MVPGVSIYWHLPVLVVVVSLVYSATRYDQWGPILREALRWGLRLVGFLAGVGVLLYLVTVLSNVQMLIAALVAVVVVAAGTAVAARK